ncbi:MAG TPA: hypothetical protein VFP90_11055 [Gemmatimonadaceae bacterium]|nr:hypothetical protein [Gemmatimonadaceae bacterium]
MLRIRSMRVAASAAIALLAACDTALPIEPAVQPQVINLRNDFAFQAASLVDVSGDLLYTFVNDGSAATVDQSPTALTGEATLFVLDGSGVQVYQHSLAENGSFATTTGTPGSWTVRVHFLNAAGGVGFRVQKQ